MTENNAPAGQERRCFKHVWRCNPDDTFTCMNCGRELDDYNTDPPRKADRRAANAEANPLNDSVRNGENAFKLRFRVVPIDVPVGRTRRKQ